MLNRHRNVKETAGEVAAVHNCLSTLRGHICRKYPVPLLYVQCRCDAYLLHRFFFTCRCPELQKEK